MTIIATIGPKGLYLLFLWLISAAAAGWLAERKGYGERFGLTFGLVLSVIGLLIMLVIPGRPGSKWKREGWRPRRSREPMPAPASGGPSGAPPAPERLGGPSSPKPPPAP